MKTALLVSLLSIPASLSSCKGQGEHKESNQPQKNSLQIGEFISEIDNKIWVIYQDQDNNYWFGSNGNGIFQYDGKILKQFTQKDGLIDNSIRKIQEDKSGNLFIETPVGINKYDGKKFTVLKPISTQHNEWKLDANDLWFSCNGSANDVYRYDGKDLYQLQLPRKDLEKAFEINEQNLSYNPYSVFSISKDGNGNVWFGTVLAGAFRYNGKSFLWFSEKELSRLESGQEPGVRSIIEDKNGNIWLSNFISKYKVKANDTRYEKFEGFDTSSGILENRFPYFNAGLIDNNENLWMTTYGGGVWKYDGKTLINIPIKDGESDVKLISIYQDNHGNIWLGSDNAGAYKMNGDSFEKFVPQI
ncbi:hypothetical protein OO010_11940 [Flavobacteriaceae bacterium KMM 6898]|nr:hypothetical protein [Flavobacteriaceae bacterium KMM 6898]